MALGHAISCAALLYLPLTCDGLNCTAGLAHRQHGTAKKQQLWPSMLDRGSERLYAAFQRKLAANLTPADSESLTNSCRISPAQAAAAECHQRSSAHYAGAAAQTTDQIAIQICV